MLPDISAETVCKDMDVLFFLSQKYNHYDVMEYLLV